MQSPIVENCACILNATAKHQCNQYLFQLLQSREVYSGIADW